MDRCLKGGSTHVDGGTMASADYEQAPVSLRTWAEDSSLRFSPEETETASCAMVADVDLTRLDRAPADFDT